ncbi:MAG: FKBP-type peptidyl-prolyl cis-trans isomerase [Prevotella sp.]|nr:FKBP-type peptidyl-prolyl cis-trans isomerase [Prevotella sp.]
MKRIAFLAVVVVLGASLSTATAGKKKDKKKKKAQTEMVDTVKVEPVVLTTVSDSVSYAGGKTATQGLIPYLQQQLKVDTAYMADFIKGYEEALSRQSDPKYTAYQAGIQIAQMATQRILPSMKADFEGSDISVGDELFHKGFVSSLTGDNSIYADSTAQVYFQEHAKAAKEAVAAAYKKQNEEWLVENAKKDGVVSLPDGLQYKVLTMGTGEKPLKEQKVKVKYEGKTIDGNVFDSSYKRNPQTSEFRCDQVIKGWTEALQMMPVGSKWELYIPQNLAYGERQAGQIKPFSTLIFTVELEDIVKEDAKDAKDAKSKVTPMLQSDKTKSKAIGKRIVRKK